jgi:type IV secretion system protein VirB10
MSDTLITEETRIRLPADAAATSDRGAFSVRETLTGRGRAGRSWFLPLVLAGGFLAILATSLGQNKPVADVLAQERDAARTAREAARTVVADPLGNRPIADPAGQGESLAGNSPAPELAPGQIVPAIETTTPPASLARNESRQDRAAQRVEQARAKAQAQRDQMRRAPLMALAGEGPARVRNDARERAPVDRMPDLGDPTELDDRLQTGPIATIRASVLANRNFLVTAGTQIPCVLQTAMDSTLPGLTSCILPRAVLSDNGRVVLLEKGTRVLGEFRGGLQQGQSRIFIVWTRAITPRGIAIDLGSPAADALGRTGLGGETETFFFKRFGGALLLSIFGDLGSAASDRISGANETARAPSQAAGIALQNDLRIQPRLRAPQGTDMTIFAARDFDFSTVYALRLKR